MHAGISHGPVEVSTSNWCWPSILVHIRVIISHDWENWICGAHRCISSRWFRRSVTVRTFVGTPAIVANLANYIHLFKFVLWNNHKMFEYNVKVHLFGGSFEQGAVISWKRSNMIGVLNITFLESKSLVLYLPYISTHEVRWSSRIKTASPRISHS